MSFYCSSLHQASGIRDIGRANLGRGKACDRRAPAPCPRLHRTPVPPIPGPVYGGNTKSYASAVSPSAVLTCVQFTTKSYRALRLILVIPSLYKQSINYFTEEFVDSRWIELFGPPFYLRKEKRGNRTSVLFISYE